MRDPTTGAGTRVRRQWRSPVRRRPRSSISSPFIQDHVRQGTVIKYRVDQNDGFQIARLIVDAAITRPMSTFMLTDAR
jgi:hypothetical protein